MSQVGKIEQERIQHRNWIAKILVMFGLDYDRLISKAFQFAIIKGNLFFFL